MCVVDWSLVADLLGALAGVIAAVVAGWALFKSYPDWLKRQNYQRKSERAEQILASFYECRRSVARVRSPLITGVELAAAEQKLKDDGVQIDEGFPSIVTAQALMTRMYEERAQWQKLNDLIPFAAVNFGEQVETALQETLRVRGEFVAAAQSFPDAEGDFLEGLRRKLFDSDPKDLEDESNQRLKTQEDVLLEHLRKYIEAE